MHLLVNQSRKIRYTFGRNLPCLVKVSFFLLRERKVGVDFTTRLLVLISVTTNTLYFWSRWASLVISRICLMQVNSTTIIRRQSRKAGSRPFHTPQPWTEGTHRHCSSLILAVLGSPLLIKSRSHTTHLTSQRPGTRGALTLNRGCRRIMSQIPINWHHLILAVTQRHPLQFWPTSIWAKPMILSRLNSIHYCLFL